MTKLLILRTGKEITICEAAYTKIVEVLDAAAGCTENDNIPGLTLGFIVAEGIIVKLEDISVITNL